MSDQEGRVFLIDLDCMRFEGIVELDLIYYLLEEVWSKSGTIWLETLACAFTTDGRNLSNNLCGISIEWSFPLGAIFLIDRIGQDYNNNEHRYTKQQMYSVLTAMKNVSAFDF